ncbi:SdrD B-like domain-containing protein [Lentzea jiangxiensis]|uniref:SD-repeat containing protein B domain-containing protein n=1 Tax=Lentzea jiangxiensis TaxID=641025 RepID=A0A1H0WMK8_9PSEU|nr:SdrD B-like domain-containing protein [Lentzea jiangxiensis]SDP91950.1 hypothetical protein SAMN05421507_120118 [Lentzea jiangxiensis]
MRKLCAAAMAAAFLLPVAGTAAAQDEISIEGLVWFDRNEDGKTAGEPGVPNEKIVKIVRDGSGELVGEHATGADGRYGVRDLPAGRYVVSVEVAGRYAPTGRRSVTTGGGTVDFGVRGGRLIGHSFLDQNRNGGMDANFSSAPCS